MAAQQTQYGPYTDENPDVKATPHDLRVSAITYLFDTDVNIVVIQRLDGHEALKAKEGYYTRKQDLDNSPVYKIDLNV